LSNDSGRSIRGCKNVLQRLCQAKFAPSPRVHLGQGHQHKNIGLNLNLMQLRIGRTPAGPTINLATRAARTIADVVMGITTKRRTQTSTPTRVAALSTPTRIARITMPLVILQRNAKRRNVTKLKASKTGPANSLRCPELPAPGPASSVLSKQPAQNRILSSSILVARTQWSVAPNSSMCSMHLPSQAKFTALKTRHPSPPIGKVSSSSKISRLGRSTSFLTSGMFLDCLRISS
jgi:hypothetical protein